ncbi:phosphorylase [Variovorax humicola]|uniref:Phosphorylase n=1 Tax=Variovorax humicola TaxID=1769758 RepID=A0ABU8W113_9BURK
MYSLSLVQDATRRALADGALQPIETRSIVVDSDGVRFVLRTVSSLVRKDKDKDKDKDKEKARHVAAPRDPLGDYDRSLFVCELAPAHYVLLNKFQLLAGHVLLVTRGFERQERLLAVEDFAALVTCLGEVDGLAFYNGGVEAGASQRHKHLQLVPLPLACESPDDVPMERLLDSGSRLPFRHAFARLAPQATAPELHALYRELLHRCGIAAVATEEGEVQSAPYNLLVRRGWMLVVPRSRACFESIAVNGLGFAGSLFLRSQEELDRVRAIGPMQVLRGVAMPLEVPRDA